MLITKNSLLRRIPKNVETRTVLFLDGIRYSIEIIDLAFRRLQETIEMISQMENKSDELSPKIVEAMSDAWVIIDSAHRLRELVCQFPKLKQKEPNVQLFLRNTEVVENLRNFVQHFRSGIDSFVEKGMPLWGTLSWARVDPVSRIPENHTIVPGTFYSGVTAMSCTFDSAAWQFIDRILLHAGEANCDIAKVFDRVSEFAVWFEKWYVNTYDGKEHHGSDIHLNVRVKKVARTQPE